MVREIVVFVLATLAYANSFEPVTTYEQTRSTEKSVTQPKPTVEEDPNAHRLKESIAVTKVHQVYEEKGYEDGAYDHGHLDEHGGSHESYYKPDDDSEGAYSQSSRSEADDWSYEDEPINPVDKAERRADFENYDDNYEEYDDEKKDYEDVGSDEGENDYEHITVPPSWKEVTTKKPKGKDEFDKWSSKEIIEFKKQFEKEWKEIKIDPGLEKNFEKWKNSLKGKPDGKVSEKKTKKPPNMNKVAPKMKKKDVNKFKYKPIKVPHTHIKGLGPFRPLVIGGKIIYPGMIAKSRNPYALMGMQSVVSVSTYPHRWNPEGTFPRFQNDFGMYGNGPGLFPRPSTAKRSPPLKRFPEPAMKIPADHHMSSFNNNPLKHTKNQMSNRHLLKGFQTTVEATPSVNLMGGFVPIIPSNVQYQSRPTHPPQRGMLEAVTPTPAQGEPQLLKRGRVKYIERLTTSHYTTPKKEEPFKPVSKNKQERIKDLAKLLNSEHTPDQSQSTRTSPLPHKRRIVKSGAINREGSNHDENKYPYYKKFPETISEDSPLNYARSPVFRPNKTARNMVLYDENDPDPCSDPKIPETILPTYKVDGEWVGNKNVERPRGKGVGESIQCLKNKYFGEDPLDNPLFFELKKESSQTSSSQSDEVSLKKRHRFLNGRKRRSVDLSRYHVVLTRQNRKSSYDYDEEEDDVKTEGTSHAETSTMMIRPTSEENNEETSTVKFTVATEPEVILKPTTEKLVEIEETSTEKVIPVTKAVRRMHRPRHAYSSRYVMTSTRKSYTTTESPPTSTEDVKNSEKKMELKKRIKFLTTRPVKFSLLPGNNPESVERVRITTTEEPITTTESLSSTKRMYPPKRKILKLRKGPFNIFSVLNDSKSVTTKFPLMDYYNEAKMSSSEAIEVYEEQDTEPSEVTTVQHPITDSPRKIKIRRPSLYMREIKARTQDNDDHTNQDPIRSNRPNRSYYQDRKKPNKTKEMERAVEVEFHQVLVQKIEPIDELSDVMPPLLGSLSTSTNAGPTIVTKSTKPPKTTVKYSTTSRSNNDSLVYSINANTGAGTWKKYREKINKDKIKRISENSAETSTLIDEKIKFDDRKVHHDEESRENPKRRRKQSGTPSPPIDKEMTRNQAYVVGLMNQVIPKDINQMGVEESPISSYEEEREGKNEKQIELVQNDRVFDRFEIPNIKDDVDADEEVENIPVTPAVVTTQSTPQPRFRKTESVRTFEGSRRRKPVRTTEKYEERKHVKSVRTYEPDELKSKDTPVNKEYEYNEPVIKKQRTWRKPPTNHKLDDKPREVTEKPRWKPVGIIEKPQWEPAENTDHLIITERDELFTPPPTAKGPRWNPIANGENSEWKPITKFQAESPDKEIHELEEEIEVVTATPDNNSDLTFIFDFEEPEINDEEKSRKLEPVQIFDPHLTSVYPKTERLIRKEKPIQLEANIESIDHSSKSFKETEQTSSVAPAVKKPLHIIRKSKPPSNNRDDIDAIKSPAFQIDTVEKRRRTQTKTKTKNYSNTDTVVNNGNDKEESNDDEKIDSMIKRRKQFLQNLLRPSIMRHKTEQIDSQPAESSTRWVKDPRQRSYFYVND